MNVVLRGNPMMDYSSCILSLVEEGAGGEGSLREIENNAREIEESPDLFYYLL